ncbi:MAG: DUF4831 family protein [Bacteroidaceae bacterium]|nr:DUF4831 family protein [Bacteroidaceae bacterium]
MRKYIFLLAMTVATHCFAQTEVNTFFSGVTEGITYYLPDTEIKITVDAICITRTPGDFNRYAEKYLRITDAITKSETFWEMTDVHVSTYGKPNPQKMYSIRINGSSASNVNLDENGVITAINTTLKNSTEDELQEVAKNNTNRNVAQYMTEEMLQATSTAKLAELTAKEIYAIRESKLAITRGQSENMPKDGQSMQLVLNELAKQEKALTELFVGRTDTIYKSYTCTLSPTENFDKTKEVLLRFSRKLGFVEKDNLAGEPVYYNFKNKKSVRIPTPEELEKKKILKKEGVCYNLPGKAEFSIYTRSKKLFNGELSIAQLGTTEILSKTLFNRGETTKITFDPATGGIVKIEK